MAALAAAAILFFTRLGFWQLHRAEEKTQMLTAQARLAKGKPMKWKAGMAMPGQYQRITVVGTFMPEIMLLDNQHYQHQFGYNVLTPLLLASGNILLVDRGWIAGDITRQRFPDPSVPAAEIQVRGTAYYPSAKHWVLGEEIERKRPNLTIIERINTPLIGHFLHKKVYPFIIRLDKEEAHGYIREWPVVAMSPERHYAYALQWFAIAFVVFLLFIILNIKKLDEHDAA